MTKKLLTLVVLFTAVVFADNIRPVVVNGPPGAEASLQSIINSYIGCSGCVNVNTDQSTAALWDLAGLPPQTAGPVLRATYAGDSEAVGIYTDSKLVEIFTVLATVGTTATLQFETDGSLSIFDGGDCGTKVNCGNFLGINQAMFGFYLADATAGQTYFTEDSRNGTPIPGFADHNNGTARSLSYLNPNNKRWAIAFEDGSDWDYNDRVITIESIEQVPDGGVTLMLLGGALVGLETLRRKFRV